MRELYMDAEKYLAIERTSRDELTEQKEVKIPQEIQTKIEELETTVRTLSRSNTELEQRVERFEAHVQRMIELEKKIDLRLGVQDRIEWEK